MNNNAARLGLLTLNPSTLSSTGNTSVVLNGTFAASSSTDILQVPSSQYGTLTFGTPAEQEEASRPRRDLRKQRGRLKASRALQQEAFQRVQSYLQNQEDRKAYPAGVYTLPNLIVPGPSNAMYGMVNAEFCAGYGPLDTQAQIGNADVPPPVSSVSYVPQSPVDPLSMCGHNPVQQHYVQAAAAPPASPMQEHAPQLPEDVDHCMPSLSQEELQTLVARLPPPALSDRSAQSYQAPTPPVPSVGPAEGISTWGTNRKVVDDDDDDTIRTRQKRLCSQGIPDAPALDAIAIAAVPPKLDGLVLDVPCADWDMNVDA